MSVKCVVACDLRFGFSEPESRILNYVVCAYFTIDSTTRAPASGPLLVDLPLANPIDFHRMAIALLVKASNRLREILDLAPSRIRRSVPLGRETNPEPPNKVQKLPCHLADLPTPGRFFLGPLGLWDRTQTPIAQRATSTNIHDQPEERQLAASG